MAPDVLGGAIAGVVGGATAEELPWRMESARLLISVGAVAPVLVAALLVAVLIPLPIVEGLLMSDRVWEEVTLFVLMPP